MEATARATYDIIFAGGGATACITAARLAQADPTLKILVLEAGPHSKDALQHAQPAQFFPTQAKAGETFTTYSPKPSDKLAGRSVGTVTGRCLGGGSAVNWMVYCRAAASDYDDWEKIHGNKGWGSKDLIPLLRKAETYQGVTTNDTHGKTGPLKISFAKSGQNAMNEFLTVASNYDEERGPIDDLNALYACNGYGRWARFVDGKTGKRSDAASAYLYPLLEKNNNLTALTRKRVIRVIFEGKRATGVEYIDDEGDHSCALESISAAYATRFVVLSSGAFGSPAILERSGIGAAQILNKNGVPELVDLPGVGEHLMDHNVVGVHYRAADYAETMDDLFWGSEDEVKPFAEEWSRTGQGFMQRNGFEAGVRLRPNSEDLKEIGPSFAARWSSYFENAPDKPVMLTAMIAGYLGFKPTLPRRKHICLASYTESFSRAYPTSSGHTHITSGSNPYAKLDYDPQYLHHDADLDVLRWAYKHSRELARRMPLYRGEVIAEHPKFPEGSEAISRDAEGPVSIDAPKIRYTTVDDRAIDEFIKKNVGTTWHSCGTCAMKPREKGGVVDERLNVYGVENLKIADLSIMPSNVGANTYNTAIAIGEKAAVIFSQDLGIHGITA